MCLPQAFTRLDDRGVDCQLKRQAKLLARLQCLKQRVQQFNPQKITLGIRTSKATWGQM